MDEKPRHLIVRGAPESTIGDLGSVLSSSSGVRGGAPAENVSVLSKRRRMPLVDMLVVI